MGSDLLETLDDLMSIVAAALFIGSFWFLGALWWATPFAEPAPKPAPYARSYCPVPLDPRLHGMPGYVRPFEPCSEQRREQSI